MRSLCETTAFWDWVFTQFLCSLLRVSFNVSVGALRLELGAEESKADDNTVALAVLGAVENISEEDWVNVYVKLVANELDILQKLSAKFKEKASGRSATRSSYSGGMNVRIGCWVSSLRVYVTVTEPNRTCCAALHQDSDGQDYHPWRGPL